MLDWYKKFRIYFNRDDDTIRTLTKEYILIHDVGLKNLKQANFSVILKELSNEIKITSLSHSSREQWSNSGKD